MTRLRFGIVLAMFVVFGSLWFVLNWPTFLPNSTADFDYSANGLVSPYVPSTHGAVTSLPTRSVVTMTSLQPSLGAHTVFSEPTLDAYGRPVTERTAQAAPTVQPAGWARELFGGILIESRVGISGFTVSNSWMVRQGERILEFYAGVYGDDVQPSETPTSPRYYLPKGPVIPYGAVIVREFSATWRPIASHEYMTPIPAGALAIVDVADGLIHLRTGLGEDLVFDMVVRQYVTNDMSPIQSHLVEQGLVEAKPQNAPAMDGFIPYTQWTLTGEETQIQVTAYTSERPYKASCILLQDMAQRKSDVMFVREGNTMALRAVRYVANDYLVLFAGHAAPVVLDLHNQQLLSSIESYSIAVGAMRPFSWP